MNNTNKERELAGQIIQKYLGRLRIKAAIKGYDLIGVDFTCNIGGEEMGYSCIRTDLEVRGPGKKNYLPAANDPQVFRLVNPVLKDLDKKIDAAEFLPYVKHFTPENMARLPKLLSYADTRVPVYYFPEIIHVDNLAVTSYHPGLYYPTLMGTRPFAVSSRTGQHVGLDEALKHALSFYEKTLPVYDPANPPHAMEVGCWLEICKHLAFINENDLLARTGYDRVAGALMDEGKRTVLEAMPKCSEYGNLARLTGEEQSRMLLHEGSTIVPAVSIPHVEEGAMLFKWMDRSDAKVTEWARLLENTGNAVFSVDAPSIPILDITLTSPNAGASPSSITIHSAKDKKAMHWLVFCALHAALKDGAPEKVTEYAREIGKGVAEAMLKQLDEHVHDDEDLLRVMQGNTFTQQEEKRRALITAGGTTVEAYELNRGARLAAKTLAELMKELDGGLRDSEVSTRGDVIPITRNEDGTGWVFQLDRQSHAGEHRCANAKLVFVSAGYVMDAINIDKATTPSTLAGKINVDDMVATAQRLGEPRYLHILEDPKDFCGKMKAAFGQYIAGKLHEIEKKREEYYEVFQKEFPEDFMEIWVKGQQPL